MNNEIINEILEADRTLLTTINFDGPTGYDFFWSMYTDKWTWMPLILAMVFCVLYPGNWKHRLLAALSVGLLVFLSDFTVSSLIKNMVCRPRPSHDQLVMNLLSYVDDYRGGPYGFPSNHASNGFAVATFLMLLMRNRWVTLTAFAWACGSCYSRMYMGVHFPTDILCGALLGAGFACLVYILYKRTARYLSLPSHVSLYATRTVYAIPVTFLLTVAALLLLSW